MSKLYKWAVENYHGEENVMKKMIQFAAFWEDNLTAARDTMSEARKAVKADDASDGLQDFNRNDKNCI